MVQILSLSQDDMSNFNWTSGIVGQGELKGTNMGISATSYPHLDIKNLTVEQVSVIYRTDWWDHYGYARITDQMVATKLLDLSVNMGAIQAHKLLQRACWAVNGYMCIQDDGVLGDNTVGLVNTLKPIQSYRSEAASFYRVIIAKNPIKAKYKADWLKRAYA